MSTGGAVTRRSGSWYWDRPEGDSGEASERALGIGARGRSGSLEGGRIPECRSVKCGGISRTRRVDGEINSEGFTLGGHEWDSCESGEEGIGGSGRLWTVDTHSVSYREWFISVVGCSAGSR